MSKWILKGPVELFQCLKIMLMVNQSEVSENIPPLTNGTGELAATDIEKAEASSGFFASVFTGSQDSCISHIPEPHIPKPLGRNWGSKFPRTVRAEQVRD